MVVFVEVLDRVDVAVGTIGGVAAIPPIAASNKSHRILYLFMWPGLSEQNAGLNAGQYRYLVGWPRSAYSLVVECNSSSVIARL